MVYNGTAVERPGVSITGDGVVGGGMVGKLRINGKASFMATRIAIC